MTDTPTAVHKIAGEVLGTFVLVFFGCGAALISGGDYVATALAFGLTVVVMAYAVGRITGGHFNPAVTLGEALGGRLPWREVILYVGSQLVGAVSAGVALWILTPHFLTVSNLLNITEQTSINAIVAVGMTYVIISGGIDLSVGSIVALSGVTLGVALQDGAALPVALAIALFVGGACGLVNGIIVSWGGLPPLFV